MMAQHSRDPESLLPRRLKTFAALATGLLLLAIGGLVSACSIENQAPNPAPAGAVSAGQADLAAPGAALPPVESATKPAEQQRLALSASPTPLPSLTPIPTALLSAFLQPPVSAPDGLEALPVATAVPALPSPLPTPAGVYSWTLKVPILMYHYVSVPPPGADEYRSDLSVTPRAFRRQMDYLAANGYETIDLYDLSLAITAKKELPEKPIIITLDDGYRDNYENAFPILQEFGFEATFFVVTEFLDQGLDAYMSWEMAEEMARAGMRIEPHSKTHADLSGQERDYVIYEILGSQETIAAHVGYKPRYFCYPGGRYDETTLAIVEELDFWGALTTASGEWHGFDNRFEWERLRMRRSTTMTEFANMVNPRGTVAGKYVTQE